jgi:hypothetical protein
MTDNKKCLVCGDIFYKKDNMSKSYWITRKYCTNKCSITVTAINKNGKQYKIPIGNMPWNKDKKMSDLFISQMNLSGLEKGRGLFKGKKLLHLSGENNPN